MLASYGLLQEGVVFLPNRFTDLELLLLRLFHSRLEQYGFPSLDRIEFKRREQSSAGRYTYVTHDDPIDIADAHLDHDFMIELDDLEAGANVWCCIESSKLQYLEIIVIGDDCWNGSEFGWRLLNTRTGELLSEMKTK